MKPSILALGRLKRQHLNILAFLYKRPCWDYSTKQIAEEIENNTKNVSAALRHMCQLGMVKKAPGIYPYRYTITDDERIPALLAKLDEKRDKKPLSPFWQGMAIWDSAVKACVEIKQKDTFEKKQRCTMKG